MCYIDLYSPDFDYYYEGKTISREGGRPTARVEGRYYWDFDKKINIPMDKKEWYIDLIVDKNSIFYSSKGIIDKEFRTVSKKIRKGLFRFETVEEQQWRYVITNKNEERILRKFIRTLGDYELMEYQLNRLLDWRKAN